MAVEIPKINYSGKIRSIPVGAPEKGVTVGGDTAYPFYTFEGEMPNTPKIAMEVYDNPPEDWPEVVAAPFRDVFSDPIAWARKCVDDYGADMIDLELQSTDPNGMNRSAEEAADIAKAVADAIDVPLVVWGSGSVEKDSEVLRLVCERCEGTPISLGPVVEGNYKKIGAAAIAYKHTIIASSPIDINLAKQLNILLGNLGLPEDKIIIDPTTGGLGYGLEYSYSVMERCRMAALTQQDDKLQYPMICNLAKEVWKAKETKISADEAPEGGDPEKRGILMESVTAATLLMAGASIVVLRHPESVKLVRGYIGDLLPG